MKNKDRKSERTPTHIPVHPRLRTFEDWHMDMKTDADPVFSFTLLFSVLTGGVYVMERREADAYEVAEKFLGVETPHDALQLFQEFGPFSVREGEARRKLDEFTSSLLNNPDQATEFRRQQEFLSDLTADPIQLGEFHAIASPISFSQIQAKIAFYRDVLVNWPQYLNTNKKVLAQVAKLSRLPPEQRSKVKLDKEITDDPRMEMNLFLGQNLPLELVFEKQYAIAPCQDIESALRATVFLDNLGIDDPTRPRWRICARPDCGETFRVGRNSKQIFHNEACNHLQAVRNYNTRKRDRLSKG